MPDDAPVQLPIVKADIVRPTKEEGEKWLAQLRQYARAWYAKPGLYLEKPDLALIVSLKTIECDGFYLKLTLAVVEATVAPSDFDATKPLVVSCAWNQPYTSISARHVGGVYAFDLYFSSSGVQRVREGIAETWFHEIKGTRRAVPAVRKLFLGLGRLGKEPPFTP